MQNKTFDEQIHDDCHVKRSIVLNSEKEFVKHIIWKDFEIAKGEISRLIDKKEFFSSANLIAFVHFELEEINDFVRNIK